METTITDYINVQDKLKELDLKNIETITLLPFNFDIVSKKEDLIYDNSVKTIRTLLRNAKLPDERIEKLSETIGYRQLNHFEWLAPTFFVSYSILTQNPHLITVSLSVLANYLTDFFKGMSGEKKVKIEIVVEKEKGKTYKKVTYKGDGKGLTELAEIVKNVK